MYQKLSIEIKYLKNIYLAPWGEKENFWYQNIKPSYNIQSIINPFSGPNHYRFTTKLSQEIKSKISKTLKGRLVSEAKKVNHILG